MTCEFQDFLDNALQDRLVCGLRSESTQKRLLSEEKINFAQALDLAMRMELAEKNAKALKATEPTVQQLSPVPRSSTTQKPCYRCGRTNHDTSKCRCVNMTCHHCGKKGHIAPACLSRKEGRNRRQGPRPRKEARETKYVSTASDNSDVEEFHLFNVGSKSSCPITVELQVEGKALPMELDTGAAFSIVSERTRKDIFPNLCLHKSRILLKTYTDERISVLGELHIHVQYGSQKARLVLLVVDGNGPSLLGRNWLRHVRLDWKSICTVSHDTSNTLNDPTLFNITQIESLPLTAQQIEQATRNDKILSKVLQYTKRGWPSQEEDVMKPYCQRSEQITVEGDCLMWGYRVIIPSKHRSHILQELHRDHPGCSRMKSVARSFIWWPGLDKDIEELSKSCPSCQSIKNTPQPAPLHPWIWPTKPWQRIHIDFAGPFLDRHFLVVVDAHSKWPEVFEIQSTSTAKTIAVLRHLFAAYGLPEQVVSDNGPQFTAEEFKTFMKSNGVKHIRCAPYHPSSNGAAERFIQTFKRSMKASQKDGRTLSHHLADFLLTYRATPHATTGRAPSTLFLQRHLRTRLSLLQPDTEKHVHQKQADQVKQHNTHAKQRSFRENQRVMVKNFRPGPKWVPGIIIKQLGPLSFLVRTSEDLEWKRHLDHIRDYTSDTADIPPSTVTDSSEDPPDVDYYTRPTHEQQSTEQPSNTTRDDASDGNM